MNRTYRFHLRGGSGPIETEGLTIGITGITEQTTELLAELDWSVIGQATSAFRWIDLLLRPGDSKRRSLGSSGSTDAGIRNREAVRELACGNAMVKAATDPMLRAGAGLRQELAALERKVRLLAKNDPVCCRLITMPGVGAVVALTFRSAVNDPARFSSPKKVGPWVGLTPWRHQSGERDVTGGITRAGDANLRTALCQAETCSSVRSWKGS